MTSYEQAQVIVKAHLADGEGGYSGSALAEAIGAAIDEAVKQEREACAKTVEETTTHYLIIRTGEYPNGEEEREDAGATLEAAAKAIRARGGQPLP